MEPVSMKRAIDDGLFRTLVAQSPRPILVTNKDVEIQFVNGAWESQFGYTLSEVRGKNPRMFQSGETPRRVFRSMWRHLRAGKVFRSDELIDKRKDGSIFNLFTTTFPVYAGKSLHYVQILDDVTQRKRHEKDQELFLNVAAHDIRSLVANLQLITELMAMDVGSARHAKNIHSMHEEIVRLSRLVTILLDPALFKAGTLKLKKSRIELQAEVRRAVRSVSLRSRPGRIRLLTKKPVIVRADPDRLQQVLTNLIENAVKYAGHSPIEVAAIIQRAHVLVTVSDRGPGISKTEIGRIFEAFFRTKHGMRSASGLGLGLHIALRIVKAHRGRIWAKRRRGGGTVFSFTVPIGMPH